MPSTVIAVWLASMVSHMRIPNYIQAVTLSRFDIEKHTTIRALCRSDVGRNCPGDSNLVVVHFVPPHVGNGDENPVPVS